VPHPPAAAARFSKEFTLATGTPQTVDLTSVADSGGNTVTFGHLVAWQYSNLSNSNGANVTIGGGTNAIIPAGQPITKGGHVQQCCPEGITVDGTHKIVTLSVASGTSEAGRLTLFGRTS
jgi:hypothetical protein